MCGTENRAAAGKGISDTAEKTGGTLTDRNKGGNSSEGDVLLNVKECEGELLGNMEMY